MTLHRIVISWAAAAAVGLGMTTAAPGNDEPAIWFSGSGTPANESNCVKGWEFTADEGLRVTALGVWDQDGNGLDSEHAVGIWRVSDQQLIASVTVPDGTSATRRDGFRYMPIPPMLLPPGLYRIAAHYPGNTPGDAFIYNIFGWSEAPGFSTYGRAYATSPADSLTYPTDRHEEVYFYFGPNFLIDADPGEWRSTTSGLWSDASNWLGGEIPDGIACIADFGTDISTLTTVTLDTDRTIGLMTFSDNGGEGSAWAIEPVAGERITLDAGGTSPIIKLITYAIISADLVGTQGFSQRGQKTLTLSGDNSGLSGTISVRSGTLAPNATEALGDCIVEIDGGRMNITNGTVNAHSHLRLGEANTGTVNHTGGTLNVSGTTRIGDHAEGQYNFEGPGNIISSNQWLVVGYEAAGELNQSGGTIEMTHANGHIYIGEHSGGSGLYDMTGGSVSASELRVGINGVARFEQSGHTTSDFATIQIARNSGSIGRMILDGPDADATANNIYIGGSDSDPGGTGELTLNDDAQLTASCRVWPNGTLAGAGSIVGTVLNGGLVTPGASPGLLQISGDYTQSSTASLDIELGGTNPGDEHDVLATMGTANLSGTLDLLLIDDFEPQPGDEFTILTASSINGTFIDVFAPFTCTIVYNADSVVVAMPTANGDLNCDGSVNTDDIAAFALALVDPAEYAITYAGCDIDRADMNDDELIDGRDIQMFIDSILDRE